MYAPTTDELDRLSLDDLVIMASAQPVLDESREDALVGSARAGDHEASETLLLATLRIAIDEAIRIRGRGLPQQELVRLGIRTLVNAAESYDPIRHGRFTSHVRSSVRRTLLETVSVC